jgi:hypothetical protein
MQLRETAPVKFGKCGILVNREAKTRSTYTGHFQLNMLHDNETKQQHMLHTASVALLCMFIV